MSHLDPPPELPPLGKALYWLTWIGGMALVVIFVLPFVAQYVSEPFSHWVGGFF